MPSQAEQDIPTNSLLGLPGELHNQTIGSLGWLDATRLSSVNQYFYSTIDPEEWPRDDKIASLRQAERWRRYDCNVDKGKSFHMAKQCRRGDHAASYGIACFHCGKVQDISAFSRRQTIDRNAKDYFCRPYPSRFCIDCGIRDYKYKTGTFLTAYRSSGFVFPL